MSIGAALLASFLVTLVRPATWALALAAFLVRGGVVLVLAPIVVIPSAVGLANFLAPAITTVVFAGVSTALILLVVGVSLGVVAWLLIGGWLAAALEAEMIGIVATDEEIVSTVGAETGPPRRGPGVALRILVVRLVALLPFAVALAWGSTRIVAVAYRELTVPSDVLTPIAIRIVRTAPEAVVVIVVAWLVGDIVGAIAARRVVLGGDGIGRALTRAAGRAIRHPIRAIAFGLLPIGALLAVLIPSAAAASTTWDGLRAALTTGSGAILTIALLVLFAALWIGGLVLIGAVSAWRAAAWTVEVAGTFGAMTTRRPGDWNSAPESGTLTDLRSRGVDPDTR
jgi:hypothetical protein